MDRLNGKIAVVTGGSSGIGLATARRFAAEGAKVFITGRRGAELDTAKQAIEGDVVPIVGDVSDLAQLDALFAEIEATAGRIDILMLNAAFAETKTLEDVTPEHFDQTFGTNVRSVVFGLQKALPLLAEGASVIITGSIAGSSGIPAMSIYGATKAALRALVRSWILELKDRAIRINVVAPGHISTPALDRLLPPDVQRAVAGTVPMGRLGQPDDIAGAALFLASDDSRYVNGAELFVDGGVNQI